MTTTDCAKWLRGQPHYRFTRALPKKAGNCRIFVICSDGTSSRVDPSVMGHSASPSGYEWGYGGSGPFCTAHSVLTHYLQNHYPSLLCGLPTPNPPEAPRGLAQKFKAHFICRMDKDGDRLRTTVITQWLEENLEEK